MATRLLVRRSPLTLGLVIALLLASLALIPLTPTAQAAQITILDGDVADLINAIEDANGTAEPDEIVLAENGTYTLTTAHSNNTGLPPITSDITITGNGATIQRSGADGTTAFRIIQVAVSGTLQLDDVTVRNGNFSDYGGGVENLGTLTVTNSTISDNTAEYGGGISNHSTLTVTDSTISGNTAVYGGGGIENFGSLTVTDSTLSGNTADAGGGLFNLTDTATLTNSIVSGNSAATAGGGIHNAGTLSVANSTVSGNTAEFSGGINNNQDSTLTVTNSTISGNTAEFDGGGLYNQSDGTMTITNSTISGNSADDAGAGIYNYNGTVTLINSTISNNTAATAGGGIDTDSGLLTLANTLIAGNSGGDSPDVHGTITDTAGGHNLIGIGDGSSGLTDGVNGNQVGSSAAPLNPLLGPLADNGGPTFTMALLSGSPAIGAANNVVAPATDQRGVARPQGLTSDIGAFELAYAEPTISGLPSETVEVEGNITGGANIDLAALGITISATDYAGNELEVTCEPTFAPLSTQTTPTTEITCVSEEDELGNTGEGSFFVTVVDTTDPLFTTVPGDQTVEATSPAGAVVSWTIAAEDIVDADPTIICTVQGTMIVVGPGDTFPIGTTTVECVAEDDSGNTSDPVSFTITVLGAPEQIENLRVAIAESDIFPAQKMTLDMFLARTLQHLEQGDTHGACLYLSYVDGALAQPYYRTRIPRELVWEWRGDVWQIRNVIGCS